MYIYLQYKTTWIFIATLLDVKIESIIIVGDFNTSFSSGDRSSRQKTNKNALKLDHAIKKMNLTDFNIMFHPISSTVHLQRYTTY